MRVRDNQSFLSLYYEPSAVEIATGGQDAFDSARSWERETRQFGQVATPRAIAALMARWVMSAQPRSVLDPAAGLGGLLAECHRINPRTLMVGVERDVKTLQRAKTTAPPGAKLILADYLKSDAGLFDGIIANPPYIKAHRLEYVESDWRYFEELLGTPLDRLTNLYALFLLKIWEDLAQHGRAAVILHAEFLNANFGEEIKERLVRAIRPAAIGVFTPSVNVFQDALTTSAVIFLEKGQKRSASSTLARVESVEELERLLDSILFDSAALTGDHYIEISHLNPRRKWLNLLLNDHDVRDAVALPNCVGDYFDCRRGIATGANDYFCLTRTEMHEHHLTESHVEHCITKATDAEGLVFTREKFDDLVAHDRRCFLLNPSYNGRALDRYLEIGEQKGIPKRHLPSHRPVWYRPENRAVADIWIAVFSRESVKVILNTSGAKNLTCFHGLYAKRGFGSLAPLMTLFLNSSAGRRAFSQVNRFYGDGLNKLEPKDVEEMPCPTMTEFGDIPADEVTRQLKKVESLPHTGRMARIDKLVAAWLGVS